MYIKENFRGVIYAKLYFCSGFKSNCDNNNPVKYRLHRSTYSRYPSLQESLQITNTLTEDALLIFLQPKVEKLLSYGWGFEPTTLSILVLSQVRMTSLPLTTI